MNNCVACGGGPLRVFYELENVPVQSCVLLDSREEALAYPTGNLRLVVCEACGFIANVSYLEEEQGALEAYESSQAHSERFSAFLRDQCEGLTERHALAGKDVVEIGCGAGDFIELLCEVGDCRGIGFDPTHVGSESAVNGRVRFIADHYREAYFETPADLIACRHTLEHIANPYEFVEMVRRGCERQGGCPVFFEVPDTQRILDERAFWDVYYEHCSYFSEGSLAALFQRCGFEIDQLSCVYDGQYLVLSAQPGGSMETGGDCESREAELDRVLSAVDGFARDVEEQLDKWRREAAGWSESGTEVVIWGGGSKAAGFLAGLGEQPQIRSIVDINPMKQGRYQAGPGLEIVAPERLVEAPPDLVVIMNRIYHQEIQRQLEGLGLRPEIVAL